MIELDESWRSIRDLLKAMNEAPTTTPCTEIDPDLWFPEKGEPAQIARDICQTCPVIRQCAAHGVKYERFGVWGGLGVNQREEIRRRLGISLPRPSDPLAG